MRYFIFENDQLREASKQDYNIWAIANREKYILPEYRTTINDTFYALNVEYFGCIEDGKDILPFILYYFEDNTNYLGDPLEDYLDPAAIDRFRTFEELHKHYYQKREEINAKEIKN